MNAGHRVKNSFISLSQIGGYKGCPNGDFNCKYREEHPTLLPEPACAQRCPEGDYQCNYIHMPEPACNVELCNEDDFTCNVFYDDRDLPQPASIEVDIRSEKYTVKLNDCKPSGTSLPEPACSNNRCRSGDFKCQYNSYLVTLPAGHDTKHHSRMFKNAAKHLLTKYTQEHLVSILSSLDDKW